MKWKYSYLEDHVLLTETQAAADQEKSATLKLLEYLAEVDRRKAFATQAYSSLFDYLVRGLRYSESQASERVNALRLMSSTPEVKDHLEQGSLTLTSAAQIQRFIQTEKRTGHKIAAEFKSKLIQQCVGQSKREVERLLLAQASSPTQLFMQEKIKLLTPDRSEIKFSISNQTSERLKTAKELLGELSLEELFDRALLSLIEAENKKRGKTTTECKIQKTSSSSTKKGSAATQQSNSNTSPVRVTDSTLPGVQPAESGMQSHKQSSHQLVTRTPSTTDSNKDQAPSSLQSASPFQKHCSTARLSRFIPISIKRAIYARSNGQCEFKDESGCRCPSRSRLQIDHKMPLALGGTSSLKNLRHLCPEHNQRARIEAGLTKKPWLGI